MPSENSARPTARLNVEALEERTVLSSFGATRGLDVALADVIPGGDREYITGTGPGRRALVRLWDLQGNLLTSFNPFGQFRGGVHVAASDIDNDGQIEIICSTGPGTTGRVRVFEFGFGGLQTVGAFIPFGPNYFGGVEISAGNVTGDRTRELVVGQQSDGALVKVFRYVEGDPTAFFEIRSFLAFGGGYTGGVSLGVANVDNTGGSPGDPYDYNYAEIVAGKASDAPVIRIFDAQNPTAVSRAAYLAFDNSFAVNRQGVNIAVGSTDGRRGAEIFVAIKGNVRIRSFDGTTGFMINEFRPFPVGYTRQVNLAIGNADDDFLGNFNVADLIVVAADGRYEQVPLLYPGAPFSPAGNNGKRLAP
jgi:hypothetical protein